MDDARLRAFGPGPSPGYDPAAAVPRTAARVEGTRIKHLDVHLARLAESAAALGEAVPWLQAQAGAIEAWVRESSLLPIEALRLRLHGAQVWALLEPLPTTPSPYRLALLLHPFGGIHPLANHKGLLGSWNLDALKEAQGLGADDALLAAPDGTLLETAIASIALETREGFWIPPRQGRVASLGERLELPALTRARPVRERSFRLEDLHEGRLWCFNAVRGVWPGILL
ncbi:MAG: aminotransferase class IV [Acidobacteria bacterium]|nr:aminotransferase class IV [Acidobacteriota bacterium]